MRNNTPREIALFIAVYITAFVFLFSMPFGLVYFSNAASWVWITYGVFIAGTFFLALFLVNYFVEKFIYKKIKVLYKVIHTKRRYGKAKAMDYNQDVLSTINQDVLDWAKENERTVDELMAQEKFRKEFIGNLAHELKTPVFTIQGYLLTLLEGGLEDPNINLRFLQKADKSLDRLITLLRELDEITKLESGEYELLIEDFNVLELAEEVADELDYKAAHRSIEIEISEPQSQLSVRADRNKIEQVLTNLITNSIKYGKQDGKTAIKFYDMDENILVEVADDGVGISQEHLPRLFERFYRVDKSRSRNQGGTGLGLAIVKHIIDVHNQSINVRSKEGEGSTFSFTLKKA